MAQNPSPDQPNDLLTHADDFARQDPAKAVASAFAFGFLLHLLPLRAMASVLGWLLLALVRPALLFLGFMRVVEFARAKGCARTSSTN